MRKKRNTIKKTVLVFLTAVLIFTLLFLSTGCVCPLFSMLERFTGLKISTGRNIDTDAFLDDLIYPGSLALVQVNGEIDRVLELIGQYGIVLSEDELKVLEQLPERIKEQEVGATAFSTPDDRTKVIDYYISLENRGWTINDFSDAGGSLQGSSMLIAEKTDRKQALMITGTENNSFIIFVDFDWDVFESENK